MSSKEYKDMTNSKEEQMAKIYSNAFDGTALYNHMRKAKKGTFLYKSGVGFCDGFILLADNDQISGFVERELLRSGDVFVIQGKTTHSPDFEKLLDSAKEESELLEPTRFLYSIRPDTPVCRVYVSKKDNKPYVFNEKYLKLVKDLGGYSKLYLCGDALVVKTMRGEFVAMILRMRADDSKDSKVFEQLQVYPDFQLDEANQ